MWETSDEEKCCREGLVIAAQARNADNCTLFDYDRSIVK